jgi:hypothetical protein
VSSGLGNTRENSRESVSVFERPSPKSLFGGSRTFFDKSKAPYRRCQNSALGLLTVEIAYLPLRQDFLAKERFSHCSKGFSVWVTAR